LSFVYIKKLRDGKEMKFHCNDEEANKIRQWLNNKGIEKYFYAISRPNYE